MMTLNDLMCQPTNVTRRSLAAVVLLAIVFLTGLCVLISGCAKKSPTVYSDDVGTTFIYNDPIDPLPVGVDSVYEVRIELVDDVMLGRHQMVDVSMHWGNLKMDGFDFLFGYDARVIAAYYVVSGPLFTQCGWEYFNYRFGPFGNCDSTCPSGMLRVVGIADLNNGPVYPDWECYASLTADQPYTVFSLDFLVYEDRTHECAFTPIRFFWIDCGDNVVAFYPDSGSGALSVGVSRYVFDKPDYEDLIADKHSGFPTAAGWQMECREDQNPNLSSARRQIDFLNGGIQIICADSIDDRGDVNLNGTTNEIADAVLFSNYFVKGIGVFNVNLRGQVAATDVNRNGTSLEIADLVYLIRIITGDALPLAPVTPVPGKLTQSAGTLSIDRQAGAAFIVLEGNIAPQLLVSEMEISYAFDGRNTRVLVSKIQASAYFEGQFLAFDANVVEAELATYDGAPIDLDGSSDTAPLNVTNHPNPFRDTTTIGFYMPDSGDFECAVFNWLGTRVALFRSTSGTGFVSFEWDASGQPAGLYVCRVEAEGFVVNHRMLLTRP